MVIGKSGTGKTETIKQIATRLNLPYTIEDATKYTQEGYYGADVMDMVYNLVENAGNDYARAEHGIIIIDEIDKKVSHEEHDVAGVEVLKSLLKLIEGTKIKLPKQPENEDDWFKEEYVYFDTKNLIIIFLGAFSGIEKIKDKRLNRQKIGFGEETSDFSSTKGQETLKQDLIAYGMPEEFVGRVDTIVEMNPLRESELVKILSNSKLSIFKRYEKELLQKGVTVEYDEALFGLIAKASLALDTGARELSNTVNRLFERIVYEVLANPNRYHKCVLSLDIVQDNTKFTLS